MGHRNPSADERVLVLAPTGADATNSAAILKMGGFESIVCADMAELCGLARSGAGAILVAEEALRTPAFGLLMELLKNQPSWSDLPLLVITTGGDATNLSVRAYEAFGPAANLMLIERPFRAITLLSTVRTALRARRRQYEVRGLVEHLEEKVHERTVRLEQTISELEAFSYSMSHDLRAPLRSMRGYSEILLEEYAAKLDPTALDYLKRIHFASERLDRLVQDVLRYSRCARENIECEPVNVEPVVREIIGEYPTLQPPRAEVLVQTPLHPVRGHPASLTQVISNLLANAAKFVKPGVTPRIRVWSELGEQWTRLYIEDNGIGIPQAHHGKIFKMFERLGAGASYEGTGIGLAIVAKAVERMGGRVGVESQPERGSTFWIELATP